ncbi:MAG: RNA 2',3'-cyclic phosphodiesterase [Pseudomonadales bacterium]
MSGPDKVTIRAFFALRLKDPIARQLASTADSLGMYDKQLEVQWIDSDNYHLTLCFLGDVALDKIDELEASARITLAEQSSLNIHLNQLDCYQANSLWTLITANPGPGAGINSLHQKMVDLVKRVGIDYSDGAFKPHITLGKLPRDNHFTPPAQWPSVDLFSLADAVILYQSKLTERGSIYTPLATIELQDIA